MRQSRCLAHLDPAYAKQDYHCAACTRVALNNLLSDEIAAMTIAAKIVEEEQPPISYRSQN